ncbi:hypothetical protein ACKUB1_12155 [Methanospirillum stamsii]|uniref:DUF2225 domain-containing protein n=1 Tax=Methanospirillum stamsii TaxID=1277351 RepID=A0A2V2MST2_9EURY|nr:hypothetical protein [Methanospirillum stamsii]PWR70469.1 hypothetical protein DLD82_15460 [Methanospirillum stamsii]
MINNESKKVTCAICGTMNQQNIIIIPETRHYVYPGLESISAIQNALLCHIQECSVCGYCAPDLSEADKLMETIVRSDQYRLISQDKTMPEIARRYMAYAYCIEKQSSYHDALFASITASRICDAINEHLSGSTCRKMAIRYLLLCKDNGDIIWKKPGHFELILADLYRRTASFEEAEITVKKGLTKATDPDLLILLHDTKSRISRWDTLYYPLG